MGGKSRGVEDEIDVLSMQISIVVEYFNLYDIYISLAYTSIFYCD